MTTRVTVTSDGVTAAHGVPFPYLDKGHVKVKVNGALTTAFTWPTTSSIQLNAVPPSGQKIEIYRETPNGPLTSYQTGAVLTKADLGTDSLQALYLAEELESDKLDRAGVIAVIEEAAVNGSAGILRTDLASSASGKGSELVSYPDPIAPAYLKTLSDLTNGSEVSLFRALPKNLHADILAGVSTAPVASYINALLAGVNTHKRGDIFIPRGDYLIEAPMVYQPRTVLRGAGPGLSKFKVNPATFPVTGGVYQILRNSNYASAVALEDGFVVVSGLAFDYNGLPAVAGGGAHALTGRYLRHVRVRDCWFKGGENATAWLACDDIVTEACTSIDPENAGFDHWDGFSVAKVIGCTVRRIGTANPDQGIMFTADPSTGAARASSHVVCIGNHISNINGASATGILVNALNAGNTIKHAVIEGNTVTDCTAAIVVQGAVTNGSVKGNAINAGGQAVVVKTATSGSPNNITVEGNTILAPTVSGGDVAVISLAGSSVHAINNIISGNSYPYAIWQQASGIVSGNGFATGSSGRILDGSGGLALILDNDTVNARNDFNKKLRVPGVLFGVDTADANLLDDYEEGSFTPVLQFGGVSTGITYGTQAGRYTKVGRLVSWQVNITLTNKGAAVGTAAIVTGLPAPYAANQPANVHLYLSLSGTINYLGGYMDAAGNILLRASDGAGGMPADATNTNFTNTSSLMLSGSYIVP